MTLLINLIPVYILFIACGLFWKYKKGWILAVGVLVIGVYMQVQPSYLPKGEIKRSDVPAFIPSRADIEDRNSTPKSGEDYDKERNRQIKDGLPFNQ